MEASNELEPRPSLSPLGRVETPTFRWQLQHSDLCYSGSGNVMASVSASVIRAYIEGQSHEHDDPFRIEGEGAPPGSAPSP